MKAVILVAGYATRLYPLTENMPKALLRVNGKPIIDFIVDKLEGISEINDIYVLTNGKFYNQFEAWKTGHKTKKNLIVINDGTLTIETRLGAIGDLLFLIEQEKLDEDMLVIAGDNYFTYDLVDFYNVFRKEYKDMICVKQIPDREALKSLGVAVLNEHGIVIDMEEKPQNPKSDKAVYATYFFKRDTIPLFKEYIDEGNKKDAPGNFLVWLHKKNPVLAYIFKEECYDIGTKEAYEQIQIIDKSK